jgi:hypothetical protein
MSNSGVYPYRAKLTTVFISLIVFLFFFIAQGNQGELTNLITHGQYAYASFGEFGNGYIYEFRRNRPPLIRPPINIDSQAKIKLLTHPLQKSIHHNPPIIKQIQFTYGDLNQIVVANRNLFAIDSNRGYIIYDYQNKSEPLELGRMDFYGIHDFAVLNNLGFIAAGQNGIYLIDLHNPANPVIIDHYDTPGFAGRIVPVSITIQTTTTQIQNGQTVETKSTHERFIAYVADGETGLLLVDFISDQPGQSQFNVINRITTSGYITDVTYKNNFLFIADRTSGIYAYDALSGGDDPTNPRPLGFLETPGTALKVVYDRGFIFVADGNEGMLTARVLNRGGSLEFDLITQLRVKNNVTNLAVDQDIALLASGIRGMYIVNIGNPSHPLIQRNLTTPGLASTIQIIESFLDPDQDNSKAQESIRDIIKELVFAAILFVFWLVFLSPFTLPYSAAQEFWRSSNDFLRFLMGNMGQSVLVEDGQLLADPALQDYSKTRPLILDNASAGLVLDQNGNTRVVGPGVDMLEPGEALIKAGDLRSSTILLGPADEDPFQSKQPYEDEIMFRQRLRRRVMTNAKTRDGIEISPNIVVTHEIKGESALPRNPFGFDPMYALQALRQDYTADKSNVDSVSDSDLNRLPGELAVQVWRNTLRFFDLKDLFAPPAGENPLSLSRSYFGLQQVITHVNRHLTQQYVEEISDNGQPTGKLMISEAYNQLEHAGLAVKRVWIVNLHIDPEHETAFLKHWIDTWPNQEQKLAASINAHYQEMAGLSRQQAALDFARATIKPLQEGMMRYRALPEQFLSLNRSLHLLAHGTRSIRGLSTAEQLKLDQMIEWLEKDLES